MKNLYSIVGTANKASAVGTVVSSGCTICFAENAQDALGIAYTFARNEYPVSKGYYGHSAGVSQVTEEGLKDIQLFLDQRRNADD